MIFLKGWSTYLVGDNTNQMQKANVTASDNAGTAEAQRIQSSASLRLCG